ncbi:EAL domain-containing protein [Pseudomonas sp. CAM1A]|uniref:EAL domain-containing protein n=1 Tax=Pseudomonas sp. CAM1A TaxID=3231717 RepID=UPI0039C6D045
MNRSKAACLENATALVIETDGTLRAQAVALLRQVGFSSIIERAGSRGVRALPMPASLTLVLCEAASLVGLDGLRLMRWMGSLEIFCAVTHHGKLPADTLGNILSTGSRMGLHMFGELPSPPSQTDLHVLIDEYLTHRRRARAMNNAVLFDPQEIDDALEKRQFIAHYRPQFGIAFTDRLRVDAEMQWRRADRTLMAQAEFLKYFDAPQHFDKLFVSMLNQVFSLQRTLKDERHDVTITLALFPLALCSADLLRTVAGLALRYGISPFAITFEIQARALDACTASAHLNLLKLRRIGFGVCLRCDGVDAAIAKERMACLPVSEITIDLHCATNPARPPAVYVHTLNSWSIVSYARALGLTVVGVVDAVPRDISQLSELGCDFIKDSGRTRAKSAIDLIDTCCRLRDQRRGRTFLGPDQS